MIRGVTFATRPVRPRTRVVVVKSDSTSRPSLTDRLRQQGMHLAYTAVRTAMRVTGDPTSRLLEGPDLLRDPYAVYADLRARGPLLTSRFPGLAVATTHAVADAALRDLHVGAPPGTELPPHLRWDSPLSPSLLDTDPPGHTRIRRLVAQAFTPRATMRMEEQAEVITAELIDAAEAKERAGGQVDLIADLAAPLPIRMICSMLGIPEGRTDRFTEWGSALALSLEPVRPPEMQRRIQTAGAEVRQFITGLFEERRQAGDPGEDVLGRLLAARDGEDRLTDEELVATTILLLGAGFETTVNLIGSGTLALLRHPDQLRILAEDPDNTVGNAVEELLRYDSPVQMTGRLAWEDTDLAGSTLPGRYVGHGPARGGQPRPRCLREARCPGRHPSQRQGPSGVLLRGPPLPGRPAGPAGGADGVRPAAQPVPRPAPDRPGPSSDHPRAPGSGDPAGQVASLTISVGTVRGRERGGRATGSDGSPASP